MELLREWRRGDRVLSTDRGRLDVALIHDFLARRSYWAAGVPRDVVERAIANSLALGAYDATGQIGFARVVTDYVTFGWLMDVFVLERARGRGVGSWMVETLVSLPELQGFRRWGLGTWDAHDLYRRFGFTALARPDRLMEKVDPDVYTRLRPPRGVS